MSRTKKPVRQMVQWHPGSKMQRFDRTLDDVAYRHNFEVAQRNSRRGAPKNFKVDMIRKGDLVLIQGVVYEAGEVDYEAKNAMIGVHKVGFNAMQRVPMWFEAAWWIMRVDSSQVDFDFRVEVVPVKLTPHPNADGLSIVKVFGYDVVVRTEEFADKDKAAFIPPNARILNDDQYYDWLGRDKRRTRVKKYRGIKSYGILVPINEGFGIGTDVQEIIQVCHYKSKAPRNKVNGNQ